ncbi:MAG TPA: L-lactate dehydrogenase [Ktedonobacteraceae bacterium]|nr:L-lactate dehydrogenase [Ktedonobacteraceae bacterium]
MLDRLFITRADTVPSTALRRPRKGAIIGAGQVGMACAYSLLIQGTFNEMVLVDIAREKLEGEVMDLVHGLSFVEPATVKAGEIADCQGADIVIITAGAKQKPGETRLQLLERNLSIFRGLIPPLAQVCPEAIFLVVSNPVDVMTYITWKLSGLPSTSVIGSGTVLDTARFRYLLAAELQLDPRSIHAYIIGEHGDSEVPLWSRVNVAGTPLSALNPNLGSAEDPHQFQRIFERVKNAAYEIIQRKGATSYAIGLAVTQVVQAILHDQNRVLTVSCLTHGIYTLDEVYISLPAVVNRLGVSRVVQLAISPQEEDQLRHSSKVLRQAIESLHL